MSKQVNKGHYSTNYNSKRRFASFWHQIDETLKTNPSNVLEIGKGSGFFSAFIASEDIDIKTLDIAADLQPDIVASVLDIPIPKHTFDTVTCCQVLEHLPYNCFEKALREIARVSKKNIIISLPDASIGWYYALHIPAYGRIEFILQLPMFLKKEHIFDGEHYWEIGKRNYPLSLIIKSFDRVGLVLKNTYRVIQNPYHRFFILQTRDH